MTLLFSHIEMMIKDYYNTLGLTRAASNEEIRKRYKDLVREFHPDRNPSNPHLMTKFSEINEAYHHLGDLDRRLAYHFLLNRNESIKEEARKRLDDKKKYSTPKKKMGLEDKLDALLKQYGK